MDTILQLKNVTKKFGGLIAVDNLSFEVRRGEIVGLIGPNGAGKTTVFNLISGFLKPTAGEIIFKGHRIAGKRPSGIAAVGSVRTFQASVLFKTDTCFTNVVGAHHLRWKTSVLQSVLNTSDYRKEREEIRANAEKILDFMGLGEFKNQLARNLPHGPQRLLGVCIALGTNPTLLLMDEPITGMTYQETKAMMGSIKQLNQQGLTMLLVEHNLREVMKVCDRIVCISFGKKLAEGLPSEVRDNEDVIEAYLG